MEIEKPKFSFGAPQPAEERDPTVRELRLLEEGKKSPVPEVGYNPYSRDPEPAAKTSTAMRTDLRKLSAWIKLKKEVDARNASSTEPGAEAHKVAVRVPEVQEPVPTVRIPRPKF